MASLDRTAVLRGALATLAVAVPSVLFGRAAGGDRDSPVVLLVVLAFFAGFVLGGVVAGRHSPGAPLTHAAAAAATAYTLAVGTTLAGRALSGRGVGTALATTVILFLTLAVSLAMVGALVGRRRAPPAEP
ncbi:MAG: hypothetical protein ACRD0D_04600 [Acidimicrobiales bacterium]